MSSARLDVLVAGNEINAALSDLARELACRFGLVTRLARWIST